MLERLVENWLDSAGERTYQRCFCQMLTGRGYRIVHNTLHTPLEFGKDVIAISPDGKLCGYQLKGHPGKTLKPYDFDQIRGQLEQLATLAIPIPGMRDQAIDECYLVTNGEIDEAVSVQISLLNDSLVQRGFARDRIKTITRGTLLDLSKSLGSSLWPSEMEDFGNLVKLLNYAGNEIFPAEVFDALLQNTLRMQHDVPAPEVGRRVTSAAVMTAVSLHSFSRRKNYFAEITAWTMFISYAVAVSEKNGILVAGTTREAIDAAKDTIYDLLGQLCGDLIDRQSLAEGDALADFPFYRARAILMYMLMALYWTWSERTSWTHPGHKAIVEGFIPRQLPDKWLWGEGAIPQFLAHTWYRGCVDGRDGISVAIATVLAVTLKNKLEGPNFLPSPYYSIEDVARHQYINVLSCDDPYAGDTFEGHSYVCEGLLMCLAQDGCKELCQQLWPEFTKVNHERVIPDKSWQYCLYRIGEGGTNETQVCPYTKNWTDLAASSNDFGTDEIPTEFQADPLLLMLFVNVFPFRADTTAIKFLHKHFANGV